MYKERTLMVTSFHKPASRNLAAKNHSQIDITKTIANRAMETRRNEVIENNINSNTIKRLLNPGNQLTHGQVNDNNSGKS